MLTFAAAVSDAKVVRVVELPANVGLTRLRRERGKLERFIRRRWARQHNVGLRDVCVVTFPPEIWVNKPGAAQATVRFEFLVGPNLGKLGGRLQVTDA